MNSENESSDVCNTEGRHHRERGVRTEYGEQGEPEMQQEAGKAFQERAQKGVKGSAQL